MAICVLCACVCVGGSARSACGRRAVGACATGPKATKPKKIMKYMKFRNWKTRITWQFVCYVPVCVWGVGAVGVRSACGRRFHFSNSTSPQNEQNTRFAFSTTLLEGHSSHSHFHAFSRSPHAGQNQKSSFPVNFI